MIQPAEFPPEEHVACPTVFCELRKFDTNMTTLYQLLILANYSVYDSPLLPHESVYDYPLPIISSG